MLGCDIDQALTGAQAAALKAVGMNFIIRYISVGNNGEEMPGDLTTSEADAILGAGLALGIVQHAVPSTQALTGQWGVYYGQQAVAHAKSIGIQQGTSIFFDLEEVAAESDASDFMVAWKAAVKAGGYGSGLYVGANCALNNISLDSLAMDSYWKSLSIVPALSKHSYCMVQTAQQTLAGLSVDIDKTQGSGAVFMLPYSGWWPENEVNTCLLTLENDLPWLHSAAQVNSIKAAIINLYQALNE